MSHPNSFKPSVPGADLSRLPAHLRSALTVAVPPHPGEVRARVLTFKTRTLNVPTARLVSEWASTVDDRTRTKIEKVVLRLLDLQGIDTLLQVELQPEVLETLIERLIDIYKLSGRDHSALLAKLQR